MPGGCARVARSCTAIRSTSSALTARPGNVKPDVRSAAEMSERALTSGKHLQEVLYKLAHVLMDEDDIFWSGVIAGQVNHLRQTLALIDDVAAKHNNRLRKDGLHGVREDEKQQTATVEQMQLL